MVEVFDNIVQLVVLSACLACSILLFSRNRSDEWLMVAGFFGCSLLALTYWMGYLVAFGQTPHYFYVAELGWTASRLFLYLLVERLDGLQAPHVPVPVAWLPVAVMVPLLVLFVTHGDVLLNVVDCSLMAVIGFHVVRGMLSVTGGSAAATRALLQAILLWWVAQLGVWTTSCFWGSEAFTPYIACDLACSATLAFVLVRAREALA